MNKKFQDLNLSNYFLFAVAAEDEDTSRLLLETLLGISVGKVKVSMEHTFLYSSDFRSIRLDVFISDEMEARYNLEMENREREGLPQRSRYHQAEMDVMSLKPGETFSTLKPVYVVFICTFDPFGRGRYRYTFESRCVEEDFALKDGSVRVFLNTKGTNDDEVPKELVHLLHYMENSTDDYVEMADDPKVRMLHERVAGLKRSREWEARYMLFEEVLQEERREGHEEGRKEGHEEGRKEGHEEGRKEGHEEGRKEGAEQILRLSEAMVEAGEAGQIQRLRKEPEFLAAMLKKYGLGSAEQ